MICPTVGEVLVPARLLASLNGHLPQVKSSMPFVASRPVGLAAIDAELALLGAVKSCCSGSDSVRSSVDVKLRRFDREKAIGQVWRGNWLSSAVTAVQHSASSSFTPP
jgi:hypothetical protein